MPNPENLVNFTSDQSHDEAVKNGRKGGIASGEARRRKRDLKKAIETLLEKDFKDINGNLVSGAEAITARLFEQAMRGNVKAFETIRDTAGQKPIDKIMISEVDPDIVEEIESIVLNDKARSD